MPCLLTGGTEVATLDTATALQQLGYRVNVIVYFDELDPAMLAEFKRAGVEVTLLRLPRAGGAIAAVRLGLALGKSLLKLRSSLVWLQYMTPTLVPLLVARLFTRRLLAAVHVAAGHYNASGMARLRWLASWWCNALVCVSHTSARGIVGQAPANSRLAQRVKVLPNAIDTALAQNAVAIDWRSKVGIAAESPVIGYVGRLAHNKGVDVLVKAADQVNRQHPECHWLIVGDGSEREHLQGIVEEDGLANRVHFVGSLPRDAVYSAMKGFDIAVVPSREEGFGLTALEAMACGVPLVASGVDALQEVVKDGETGLLFSPGDSGELAEALVQLLASSEQRHVLARAASRHAGNTYGRQAFVEKLGRLLNEKAVMGEVGK
ncbi:glycosyltransferase family 4 protein [Marinobacter sp. chi1]|uniref:Glycosyltransferase family 4 protein n=1 Tax=Marinobacter suaedae TaxID=3057675 RepID=A0ABT8VWF4_9GAMM|nr:glycosyltransferase family 4 protein [Marinobacter sp. chi1]MDO3720319.1 glycosyltransferase family 4 protein [Marinobacter sp. chi1]